MHSFYIDFIDVSNRILLYIIVSTFSYLLLTKLYTLHNKQAHTIIHSMELTIEQVVQSFIVAVEAKDQYTFGHSERVSQYAVALAKQLPEFQEEHKLKYIRLSGLIHDIGKINIPEQILTKPTKLTEKEYQIIKSHPTFGAQMVEKVEGLEEMKSSVLYHHERWDGKGYPTGAEGKEIPIVARILAVADAFDAMTSTRAYRDELPIEEAFQRLEGGIGTQFDPNLAQAIEHAKPAFKEIYYDSHDPLNEFEELTNLL
ncbi:HD-GYP domain-containing protein [Paraliobacillus sp. JSM ZJ581]|uniref:HD-GYP domain-containing protein n=1 Tax=Paraliobacillus sp. JSM ZJ581 TaxID=3342118 RepID=UPI0035A8E198